MNEKKHKDEIEELRKVLFSQASRIVDLTLALSTALQALKFYDGEHAGEVGGRARKAIKEVEEFLKKEEARVK